MDLPGVIRDLPGEMIPEGLAAVHGYRDRLSKLAFEQRCAENAAYCRRVAALYCLYRTMYADAEAELLGLPADAEISDLRARQRDLRLRETELQAQVSVVRRVGASAADRAVEEAVGFVERLPRVFGLIAAGVISVPAGARRSPGRGHSAARRSASSTVPSPTAWMPMRGSCWRSRRCGSSRICWWRGSIRRRRSGGENGPGMIGR